ncbi:MAG: hypothetical protein V4670_12185 [Bacteroidota bacterium]
MITIEIPVKSHIKKYLSRKHGSVCQISKKTFIGLFLCEMLEKDIEKSNPFPGDHYEVVVPEYYFNKKGYMISQAKLRTIGLSFETLFTNDFLHFVDNKLLEGNMNAYQSVVLFLKLYQIKEDELKLESMYRKYQRYCGENIKEKKQSLVSC